MLNLKGFAAFFCIKYLAEHALKLKGVQAAALKSISGLSNEMISIKLVQRFSGNFFPGDRFSGNFFSRGLFFGDIFFGIRRDWV